MFITLILQGLLILSFAFAIIRLVMHYRLLLGNYCFAQNKGGVDVELEEKSIRKKKKKEMK
jgi:hypothetical protein